MAMPNVRQSLHSLVSVPGASAVLAAASSSLAPVAAASPVLAAGASPSLPPVPEVATAEGGRPSPSAAPLDARAEAAPAPTSQSTAPAQKDTIGVFLTPQSLVTFPVASAALVVVWKVLIAVFPEWGASKFVPFIGAFVLGMFIYYISLPENPPSRLKIIAAGVGVLNSFFLAASALGIQTVT